MNNKIIHISIEHEGDGRVFSAQHPNTAKIFVGEVQIWPPISSYPQTSELAQLSQLAKTHVWDGNLVSKDARDSLVKTGLVERQEGWNFLNASGIRISIALGILRE